MNIETLHQLFLSSTSVCTDTRKIARNCMFFALKGENFNGNKFAEDALDNGAKYAIIDEQKYKLNDQCILVKNVLQTLQQLAQFHRAFIDIPIIGLTGSNGKTTTKELINVVLKGKFNVVATKGNLNNHIGVPLTLLSMNKDTEIGIVEMGANHLNEIAFLSEIAQPDFGYITNFGKAHLEGFGSEAGVIKGKTELYQYLKLNDKMIFVNWEDEIQVTQLGNYSKYYSFGQDSTHSKIDFLEANPFVDLNFNNLEIHSHLIGAYNFSNISAAIAFGNYFGVNSEGIKNAIETYIPDNNRSQIIQKGTNKVILDAYNANPTSMQAALESFNKLNDRKKIAILGDMFELGSNAKEEHQNILDIASLLQIDSLILIGENFYLSTTNSTKVNQHKSFEDFTNEYDIQSIKNATLLIKGSRGMELERVLKLL